MPQLPYHKYLGPGNELSGDDPVDTDDAIALEHDSAYETALSAEDILKADENAILDFWDDFSTSGNWHSLVGAAGLTLKHQVEKQVGVLYPEMPSKHQYKALTFTNRREEHEERQRSSRQGQQQVNRDRMQSSDQPSSSHDVSDIGQDETNSPMATDAVDAPQSESSIGNHSGVTNPSGNVAPLYFNTSLASPSVTFFKKSRLMHTWGFASSKFARGATKKENDYLAYTTSLAYLPVDWVPFYLSPVEYNNLPIGSYIKEVYVEVIPKGVRCSFDVGTSLTGSANSMHVIFGKHCIGLNQKLDITNMSLKPNDKSPMTISEIGDISADEFTNRFYGNKTNYHSSQAETNYPTSWGANRALPYYACVMATTNESTKNAYHVNSGWPRIDNIMERYNLNEHINIPIIKYSYKPKNGILKHAYHNAIVPNKVKAFINHTDIGKKTCQYIQDEAFAQNTPKVYPLFEKNGQKLAYENIVDKYHMFASNITLDSTKAQPQVHFGIEPVQANAPTDTSPTFVNASAEYEIQCSCVVGFNNNFMFGDSTISSKNQFLSGFANTKQHYYLQQPHIGGYYSYNWSGKYNTTE